MASDCKIEDYLEDSLERARGLNESYATALFSNLAILRPDLTRRIHMTPDDLYSYNPRKWNQFFDFLSRNWYS